MKAIVAGTRTYNDRAFVFKILNLWKEQITEIVSGKATGADTLGEMWANENGIPVKDFPADWSNLGKIAGPIRNAEMAKYGDMLFAFWDGKSPGTRNMIACMKKLDKPCKVYMIND